MYLKEILLVGILTSLTLTVFLFIYSSIQQEELQSSFGHHHMTQRHHQRLPQLRGSLLTYKFRSNYSHSNQTMNMFNSSTLLHHELYSNTLELERLAPEPVHYFSCRDASNSKAVLNDNYCDCVDGSDENMTSACSHVLAHHPAVFQCHSQQAYLHFPRSLFASRVNDGVCDCADGSDEYDSPLTVCRNHIKMWNLFNSF